MAVRALADAFVRIRPDTSGFRAETDAKLNAALAGKTVNVLVKANTDAAKLKMKELRVQMEELGRKVTSARLVGDDKQLQYMLAKVESQLRAMAKRTTAKKVTLEGADKIQTQLMGLNLAADKWISKALDKHIDLDSASAEKKLAFLIVQGAALSQRAYQIRADVTGDAEVKVAEIITEMEALTKQVWKLRVGVDDAEIERARVSMQGLHAQLDKLVPATDAATKSATRLWGVWGLLGRKVPLLGGLSAVTGWHILVDGLIEAFAILVPAVVTAAAGLAAFAIAGSDAAKEVMQHFQALHTVADATGKTIPPMTGSLEKLHAAVRPQVFQLLGDAIDIAASKTDLFRRLALGTGRVLDTMAAHFTVAITHAGQGLTTFLKAGQVDLAQLGRVFSNIGEALLRLIKVTQDTHIADFLLKGLVAASKLLELITRLPTPILAVVVGLHGLWLWGGLATTGLLKLISPLLGIGRAARGVSVADTAVGSLAAKAGPIKRLKAAGTDLAAAWAVIPGKFSAIGRGAAAAETKVGLLARAGNLITKVPWQGWVVVAAAALGFFIFKLATARTRAEQFSAALLDTVKSATNFNVFQTISAGLDQLNQRIAASRTRIAELSKTSEANRLAMQGNAQAVARFGASAAGVSGPLTQAKRDIEAYRQATGQLNEAQMTANSNAQFLAKTYHVSLPAAIALAQRAGVNLSGALKGNNQAAEVNRQKIDGLVKGYGAMATQSGALGNDMEMLTRQQTDQYKATQQLNAGWDTFIGTVTASQTSFDTFALGLNTLSSTATTASTSLGLAHQKIGALGNAIDGLSKKDLALNQAFSTQVGNTNALIDTWRTAGLAGNIFTDGVKASIIPLTKYAKGSEEATAQLVALAQEAGYRGPASLKSLTEWLGHTKNATQRVKDAANQATIQEGLLTTAMHNQGNYISNTLLNDINQEILKTDSVRIAAKKYGDAIAEDGRKSEQAKQARMTLIDNIIKAGKAAGDTTGQIQAMITKVTGIPKSKAMQLILYGTGSFSITGAPGHELPHHRPHGARGMYVTGGSAGRDSVDAVLMPGEVVVPTKMVAAGAVDHLRGKIPGFAQGGVIGDAPPLARTQVPGNPRYTGNKDVFTGQYAVDKYNEFAKKFSTSMLDKIWAAMVALSMGGTAGLKNPLRAIRGLVPERIDMGVDYAGNGPIYAIGPGKIAAVTASWRDGGGPIGTFINERLTGSPYAGKNVYFAENIRPRVSPGDTVGVNSVIGDMVGGVEFGWASGNTGGTALAAALHEQASGDPGAHVSAAGANFNKMMVALGAPSGIFTSKPFGKLPPGYYSPGAKGQPGQFAGKGRLTQSQIAQLWDSAGGPGSLAHIASAVAMAESRGFVHAHNPSGASGLWQILGQLVPGNIFDPMINAKNAVAKYHTALGTNNFSPWTTYTSGAYRAYMAAGGLVKGYGGGTGGAAPGWGMVGENGPELVNFNGGEEVVPMAGGGMVPGYAKGTHHHRHHHPGHGHTELNRKISNVLHYIYGNRNEPVRYTHLTEHLELLRTRMDADRTALNAARLTGHSRRRLRHELHREEREQKRTLHEMHPYLRTRSWVHDVIGKMAKRDRHFSAVVGAAQRNHLPRMASHFRHRLKTDEQHIREMDNWLGRLGTAYTHRQQRRDEQFVDNVVRDAIQDAGLPLIKFDQGGYLPMGTSLSVNNTGRPERVLPGGAGQAVTIHFDIPTNSGHEFDRFMINWICKTVRTKGGGDVQFTFGQIA